MTVDATVWNMRARSWGRGGCRSRGAANLVRWSAKFGEGTILEVLARLARLWLAKLHISIIAAQTTTLQLHQSSLTNPLFTTNSKHGAQKHVVSCC